MFLIDKGRSFRSNKIIRPNLSFVYLRQENFCLHLCIRCRLEKQRCLRNLILNYVDNIGMAAKK